MSRPLIVLLLAAALLASACSQSAGGGQREDGPPRQGGTLTLGIATPPDCIDPQQVGLNAGLNVGRQLVDSLTDQDPETGEITPWLAERWEVGDDARSFTFHLREGATFSDGSPVDAAAVKASFDGIKELGPSALVASGYLAEYTGTTVAGEYTARVEFAEPSAQFLQATSTMSLGLLAPSAYEATPEQRCHGDGLIGSGPFVFESFTQNQEIVIGKRRGYTWGSSLWEREGEAYLDKVIYRIVPEPGVRTGSLVSGQLDAITDVQPVDEARFEGGGFIGSVRSNPGIVFNLHANTARGVLAEENVRKAVQKAVNRKEVSDTVLSPNYKPASSILAASTPLHTDLSAELTHDPDGASALLAAAGWVEGPDGIRVRNGERLSASVIFSSAFNQSQSVLELVQQQLKAIGFELRVEPHPTPEVTDRQQRGDYEFLWYNVTRADPDILRNTFSTGAGDRSKLEPGNPLDVALDKQAASTDAAVRAPAAAEAQRLIVEHAYAIPVFELSQVIALGPTAHDIAFEASSRLRLSGAWVSPS
ncbi:ABC transporter substrate-binding protein [Saccharomonospora sp. NPDC006951]